MADEMFVEPSAGRQSQIRGGQAGAPEPQCGSARGGYRRA